MSAEQNEGKRKRKSTATPVSLSPAERLDVMIRGRIDALEQDKLRLRSELERLQSTVDRLGPANARLEEALGNAESNNIIATILIGVGGFLVSYATFTGKAADKWANIAAGCLLAGIGLLSWQSFRRWRRR